jgi:UDP-2,3-diacylglucosamine pyrophosphatase LpxH
MCPAESRRRLARFIHQIRRSSTDAADHDDIELVINGDLVDFLAEEPFEPFTTSAPAAADKLRNIIRTADEGAPEGEQVFPALRQFIAEGHRVTLLIGNHDLELALPAVRQELLRRLTDDRPARVEFLLDGEACRRGAALIEHGNRYDGWNAVAHGALRAVRARASRDEPVFPFVCPPGSRLVIEVMNPLKRLYKFIDLLKPENEAVIPLIAALHPTAMREMRRIFNTWRQTRSLRAGDVPDEESYIAAWGADDAVVPDDVTQIADRVAGKGRTVPAADRDLSLNEVIGDEVDRRTLARSEAVLSDAEALARLALQEEVLDLDLVPDEYSRVGDGLRAWLQSTASLARMRGAASEQRYRYLRTALVSHRNTIGATFRLDSEHADYLEAARRLAHGETRFVIFGHTHLPKSIALDGGARYLNTGTWCPTIRLDERLYETGVNEADVLERLRQFVEDMSSNRLGRWTSLRTPFAHVIVGANGETTAELCEFHDDGRVTTPMVDEAR